jgi:hypothetical protein
MMTARTGILVVTLGSLLLGGCDFEGVATGPEHNDPISLDAGNAQRANVELDMGRGS